MTPVVRVPAMPRRGGARLTDVLRCVLVDDDASFLDAATKLLERDGVTVAGVASTGADAVAVVDRERRDVVLDDITLGTESGFDVARRLAENRTEAAVILISTHAEADFAELIETSPAVGFVPKSDLSGSIVKRLASEPRGT